MAEENIEYLRHLGLTSAKLDPTADNEGEGWIYLNLNQTLASGDPYPGRAQAWVITSMSASGLYEVGYDAIALDNATSSAPGGVVLIP